MPQCPPESQKINPDKNSVFFFLANKKEEEKKIAVWLKFGKKLCYALGFKS